MKIEEEFARQDAERSERVAASVYATEVDRIKAHAAGGPSRIVLEEKVKQEFAKRDNRGKPELSQLMHFDLEWLARHCEAGRYKYPDSEPGVPNWTLGGKPDQEYIDSMLRHIQSFVQGSEFDEETGTHHLAAVAWNALALLTNNRKMDI